MVKIFRAAAKAIRRTPIALATAGVMGITLVGAPAASAAPAPAPIPADIFSSEELNGIANDVASELPGVEDLQAQAEEILGGFDIDAFLGQTADQAWDTRNQLLDQVSAISPQAADVLRDALDGLLDLVFPGLPARKIEEARQAREAQNRAEAAERERLEAEARAAAEQARREKEANRFDTGPCPADADVCVDIDGRRTWLQDGGRVSYIAPSMAPGKKNPQEETPRGTFYVNRKVKDEISYEFGNAAMPNAIYFTNNGHAFHMGDPAFDSAGCVRLPYEASYRYWDDLQIGDKVFIY